MGNEYCQSTYDQEEERKRLKEKIEEAARLRGEKPDPNWPPSALGNVSGMRTRFEMRRRIEQYGDYS